MPNDYKSVTGLRNSGLFFDWISGQCRLQNLDGFFCLFVWIVQSVGEVWNLD